MHQIKRSHEIFGLVIFYPQLSNQVNRFHLMQITEHKKDRIREPLKKPGRPEYLHLFKKLPYILKGI